MTSPIAVPLEFDRLPVEERIAYVQALWDRIASDPDSLPVPAEHQRVLVERLSAYAASSDSSVDRPWPEVREQLIVELNRR
jgi:putative addiction module component (TIGR02574 family)